MGYKKTITEIVGILLDFIYPRNIYCIVCGIPIQKTEPYSLCPSCRKEIFFIHDKACVKCGKPLETLYLPIECQDCMKMQHYFTKAFSCVVYDGQVRELIHKLKYAKQRYVAYHMAEMMIQRIREISLSDIDWVIPIPLHKQKRREREFNQSEILAQYIANAMEWKLEVKNLLRVRNTQSQNKLSKQERNENLKNAFQLTLKHPFEDKNILLIDDIYTTGSTVDACSKELKKANPKAIYVLSFATGRNV